MGDILVGTSSWTDPSLIACGRFYPETAKSAEARLRYYSSQFSLVEVDSTYYSLPEQRMSWLWTTRTPDDFLFDIKAFRLFTQHPTPLNVLPKDIRAELSPKSKEKTNIYLKEFPDALRGELLERFKAAVLPLRAAGKLGALLFQFPSWFLPGAEQREYILYLRERLSGYQLAIEFRNGLWLNQRNEEKTFDFLRDNSLSFVCVDEPQGFKSSVPPLAEATSSFALVRFHGRNQENWEKKGLTASERFDYLYTDEELKEWVPKVEQLKAETQQVHVLFNNCYQDKAAVNAKQMKELLKKHTSQRGLLST
jgi:uncharacterized protein YecE (DUF72 family)